MNQRSTKIVQLLSKEKDEITVSGFAEYFQVSQKTIRNDMKGFLSAMREESIDLKALGIRGTSQEEITGRLLTAYILNK